ncbi:MAG: hypothetical protein QM426_09280 [Euryarchaeota archaeon]|nr:hypothetical protein [Euryarchaeota archaeon]
MQTRQVQPAKNRIENQKVPAGCPNNINLVISPINMGQPKNINLVISPINMGQPHFKEKYNILKRLNFKSSKTGYDKNIFYIFQLLKAYNIPKYINIKKQSIEKFLKKFCEVTVVTGSVINTCKKLFITKCLVDSITQRTSLDRELLDQILTEPLDQPEVK